MNKLVISDEGIKFLQDQAEDLFLRQKGGSAIPLKQATGSPLLAKTLASSKTFRQQPSSSDLSRPEPLVLISRQQTFSGVRRIVRQPSFSPTKFASHTEFPAARKPINPYPTILKQCIRQLEEQSRQSSQGVAAQVSKRLSPIKQLRAKQLSERCSAELTQVQRIGANLFKHLEHEHVFLQRVKKEERLRAESKERLIDGAALRRDIQSVEEQIQRVGFHFSHCPTKIPIAVLREGLRKIKHAGQTSFCKSTGHLRDTFRQTSLEKASTASSRVDRLGHLRSTQSFSRPLPPAQERAPRQPEGPEARSKPWLIFKF